MANVPIGLDGQIELPDTMREKYHLTPETSLCLIETRTGILLVPITDEPMSEELAGELADWQSLSLENWALFPYEEVSE